MCCWCRHSLPPFIWPTYSLSLNFPGRLSVSLGGVGTLQQVQVPIISTSSCQMMYDLSPSEKVDIRYDMICAGYQEGGQGLMSGTYASPVCHSRLTYAFSHPSPSFSTGGLWRTPGLPNGERDLGAGRGGEFWPGLCPCQPPRCLRQGVHLLQLHPKQHTRDPSVRTGRS